MTTMNRTLLALMLAALLSYALACSHESDDPVSPMNSTEPELSRSAAEDTRDEKHGNRIPFADAEIFFEFNSTDDDLGVQIFLDGEAWKRVKSLDPRGRKMFEIHARGRLRELGITELFFESAEPSPGEVLALFKPGEYRFVGKSLAGDEMIGRDELSHELPPAPVFSPSNGEVVAIEDLVIEWQPMPGLDSFQLIVADEESGASLTADLPAETTSLRIPEGFLENGVDYKVEVLAIAENGNKTITEGFFSTVP